MTVSVGRVDPTPTGRRAAVVVVQVLKDLREDAMEKLTVVIQPGLDRTRLLATCGTEEILKAVLAAPREAHHRAAPTLLESLALWCQRPAGVVLALGELRDGAALGLCDEFGFGGRTLHYNVDVRRQHPVMARPRLAGVGDFRALRRAAGRWGGR